MGNIKTYEGVVTLGAAHSLIIGHGPKMADLGLLEAEAKLRLSSLGLFSFASNESIEEYKGATDEEKAVSEDTFIRPVYRALSEVIVRKQWDPIDFTEPGILKASMDLLLGQTIYKNHYAYVDNEIGAVSRVFWDKGYKTAEGLQIPAGINAEFLIDSKLHPQTAGGIMMNPPALHSNSVTVNFGWEQSHPKLDFNTFRSKVGTYDDKGELIRRIVSDIRAYYETSLVPHGADPFAQKTDKDGKIVNPVMATNRDSFCLEKKGSSSFHFFSYKDSFSDITIPSTINNNNGPDGQSQQNPNKMDKELIMLLATLAGVTLSSEQAGLSDEAFAEQFDQAAFKTQVLAKKTEIEAFKEDAGKLAGVEAELETLKEEAIELKAFKVANEKTAESLAEVKATALAEVKRLHEVITGKPANESMTATFDGADLKTLAAFTETYNSQLEDKFPAVCQDCQSTNIARNSTKEGGQGDGGNGGGTKKALSQFEVTQKLKANRKNVPFRER